MMFTYRRDKVLQYAKTWFNNYNVIYPDYSSTYTNNVSYAYQCVLNGGYYIKASQFFSKNNIRYPVLYLIDEFEFSLQNEIKARRVDSESPLLAQTGDIVILNKQSNKFVAVIEKDQNVNYMYSHQPNYRKKILEADSYTYYFLPDYGDF